MMSGSNLAPWAISRNPKIATMKLAKELDCNLLHNEASHFAACLRGREMNEIVTAVRKMIEVCSYREYYNILFDYLLNEKRNDIVTCF